MKIPAPHWARRELDRRQAFIDKLIIRLVELRRWDAEAHGIDPSLAINEELLHIQELRRRAS